MTITPELIAQHQLTQAEYDKIVSLLGREPSYTELGVFSVMWSEHCSYKSSRIHLKKLPTEGKYVVQGPGENAGNYWHRRRVGHRIQDESLQPPAVTSNPFREQRPAWAVSSATSSPWALALLR